MGLRALSEEPRHRETDASFAESALFGLLVLGLAILFG